MLKGGWTISAQMSNAAAMRPLEVAVLKMFCRRVWVFTFRKAAL